jgi:hypothetical protein
MGSEDRTEYAGLALVRRPEPMVERLDALDRRLDALQSQLTSITALLGAVLDIQKMTGERLSLLAEAHGEPACR